MAKTMMKVSSASVSNKKGGFFFHAGMLLMIVALMLIVPMFLMIPVLQAIFQKEGTKKEGSTI